MSYPRTMSVWFWVLAALASIWFGILLFAAVVKAFERDES